VQLSGIQYKTGDPSLRDRNDISIRRIRDKGGDPSLRDRNDISIRRIRDKGGEATLARGLKALVLGNGREEEEIRQGESPPLPSSDLNELSFRMKRSEMRNLHLIKLGCSSYMPSI
jgi:hypothetical protein